MEQTPIKTRPDLKQEVVALCGIFFACFLFLSLLSMSLGATGNWGGELGRILAQFLVGFTGVGGLSSCWPSSFYLFFLFWASYGL